MIRRLARTLVLLGVVLPVAQLSAEPVLPGQTFPAFDLPALQGGQVSLASLRGKNVIVVVPRVRYGEGKWCTICNYGYAELAALDASEDFRRATNTEVVFVSPFGRDITSAWIEATPAELAKIGAWKNPSAAALADPRTAEFTANARRLLSLDLVAEPGKVAKPFPILLDAERTLTGGLGVFSTSWGGAQTEQGIPAVYILDRDGVVRFKHVAQTSTWDRPETRTILDFVAALDRQETAAASAETIMALERAALERWGRGDPEGFLELSAADVVYFDPYVERRVDGREALRARYATIRGKIRVDRFEMLNPKVQVCGEAAVLTFNHVSHIDDRAVRWNCTEVFRRKGASWEIIQSHWSYTTHPAVAQGAGE